MIKTNTLELHELEHIKIALYRLKKEFDIVVLIFGKEEQEISMIRKKV